MPKFLMPLLGLAFSFTAWPAHAAPLRTRNLVVVVVDGVRWKEVFRGADPAMLEDKRVVGDAKWAARAFGGADASTRRSMLMPVVWSTLAKEGRLYGNRDLGSRVDMRNPLWFSFPGRAEMFTGKVNPAVNSNDYGIDHDANVFEFLTHQSGLDGQVAGFASWKPVGDLYDHTRSRMFFNVVPEDLKGSGLAPEEADANTLQRVSPTPWGDGERLDNVTFAMAHAYLTARHPRVLVLDIGNADEFAHDGLYDRYLEAIHASDAMIGNLWQTLQADSRYRDTTTLIVVPDHGRGDGAQWTSHGSKYAHSGETWLAVIGPDTPSGGELHDTPSIVEAQLATTIARFMGADFTRQTSEAAPPIDDFFKPASAARVGARH